jgi:hypothetical protein
LLKYFITAFTKYFKGFSGNESYKTFNLLSIFVETALIAVSTTTELILYISASLLIASKSFLIKSLSIKAYFLNSSSPCS